MLEILGFLGAMCLTVCSIPQLIKTVKTKDVKSFDIVYLWLWFLGVFFMFFYVYNSVPVMIPLLFNYALNTAIVGVLLYYYYKYY